MDRVILDGFGMIKERVITILKWAEVRLPKLEEETGISRYTWANLKNPAKSREIKEEEIEAIAKVFPQYRWWMLTGEIMPDKGQISPEYDEANKKLPGQNAELPLQRHS